MRLRLNSITSTLTLFVCTELLLSAAREAGATAFTTQSDNLAWDSDTGAGGLWTPDSGNFYPQTGDTATWGGAHRVNVTSPEVFSGGSAAVIDNPFLYLTSTLTLDSGTFTLSPPSTMLMGGNSSGKFIVSSGATVLYDVAGGSLYNNTVSVENNGTVRWTANGDWNFQSGRFVNNGLMEAITSGGQISDGGSLTNSATGTIVADGSTFTIGMDYFDGGGDIVATNAGIVRWNVNTQPVTTDPNTTFTTYDTGQIQLGGKITALQGSINGDVIFGKQSWRGDGFIDLNDEVIWEGNGGTGILTPSGSELELRSPFTFIASPTYGRVVGGVLRNATGNTMILSNDTFYLDTGCVLQNLGTLDLRGTVAIDLNLSGTHGLVSNAVGGTIVASDGTPTIRDGTSSPGGLDNDGTVQVNSGITLTIGSTMIVEQYDSGSSTLNGGTWDVTGTLNFDPANTPKINVIGASAKITLGGVSASLPELDLTTINGTLGLEDDAQYSTTGALSTTGTLELGLDGADLATELLVVNGVPTFTGGTVDVVDLGDMIPGTYVLISWTAAETGVLTLGTTPANGFTYLLQKNGMTYELVVGSGFEPATIMKFF